MPEKVKKNLLGREVQKTTLKSRNADGGYNKSKMRIVYDKSGNVIKAKNKKSTYVKDKEAGGKLTQYKKVKGSDSTVKLNIKQNPGATVTKRTIKNSSGTNRSVETKKPGYTSTQTNMGPLSQALTYRNQIKKIK